MASGRAQALSAAWERALSDSRRCRAGVGSERCTSLSKAMRGLLPRFPQQNKSLYLATQGGAAPAAGQRVAGAAQAIEVGGLDRLAQESHVAVDLALVQARPVEVRRGVAV